MPRQLLSRRPLLWRSLTVLYLRRRHPPTLGRCRTPPLRSRPPPRPSALVDRDARPQRSRPRRAASLYPAVSDPGRRCRPLPRPCRRQHADLSGRAEVADRPRLRRHRPGRARDGVARALLRPVRGRRRPRRVLGGALLHGQLARRARHRGRAQRRLRARRQAEPRVLRDDADRRDPVAPDHRHDAGPDGRRLEPVDGAAQHRDGDRRDGDADHHQPGRDDAGAGDPRPRRPAFALLRPARPRPVARQPGPDRRLERDRRRGAERGAGRAELPAGGARGRALHRVDRARLRHRGAAGRGCARSWSPSSSAPPSARCSGDSTRGRRRSFAATSAPAISARPSST